MTEYLIPDTLEEALGMLAAYGGRARIIAGGTDVLPDIRKGKYAPACLVDVTRIPELARIEIEAGEGVGREAPRALRAGVEASAGFLGLGARPAEASIPEDHEASTPEDHEASTPEDHEALTLEDHVSVCRRAGCVTVGAAVTFAQLREHPYLQQHVHALVEAAASVGAAPIQTAATWGGNLAQAMPAADGAIVAVALDAELRVVDAVGARWLPALEAFLGPGRSAIDPTRQVITAIRFPLPAAPWGTAWRRAGRRPSLILPTLNCAVKLVLSADGRCIAEAAIALGPVAVRPHRAAEAEAALVGRAPGPAAFAEAAHLAGCDADPRTSVQRASREYRLAILPVLVEDALAAAAERAQMYRSSPIT